MSWWLSPPGLPTPDGLFPHATCQCSRARRAFRRQGFRQSRACKLPAVVCAAATSLPSSSLFITPR